MFPLYYSVIFSPPFFNLTKMEDNDELLVRRKRVDSFGEWEYECSKCLLWLPKTRFRGCVDYIDAYGNCLMCSSCKGKKTQETQKKNMKKELNRFLQALGYDTESDIPVHIQFAKKHNLPINNKD